MQRRHMPVWKPICNYVENDYRCKLVEISREHSTPVRDASRTSVNLEQVTDDRTKAIYSNDVIGHIHPRFI